MAGRTRVSVAGWACANDMSEVDVDGCSIVLGDIKGWFDIPAMRANPVARPLADGSWDGQPTIDSRSVTVSGTIVAPSESARNAAMDRLATVLSGTTRYDTLTVDEVVRGLSRQSRVRLASSSPLLFDTTGHRVASFSLGLFAPDPLRYSTTLHTVSLDPFAPSGGFSFPASFPLAFGASGTSGRVTVSNAGARGTWPTLVMVGPLTNPAVTRVESGETLAVAQDLAAGQTLTVDCAARSVLLGSASRRQQVTSDAFFALPPGDSTVYFAADDGDGTLTVQWRDAW